MRLPLLTIFLTLICYNFICIQWGSIVFLFASVLRFLHLVLVLSGINRFGKCKNMNNGWIAIVKFIKSRENNVDFIHTGCP